MMGLDTTHDCWHGAYSAFNRWRTKIAELVGIPLYLMEGYCQRNDPEMGLFPVPWETLKPDPIHVLLDHYDCEGNIPWQDCGPLADRLEEIIPMLPDEDGGGHIGNWRDKTNAFIRGLRAAHEAHEDVEFH